MVHVIWMDQVICRTTVGMTCHVKIRLYLPKSCFQQTSSVANLSAVGYKLFHVLIVGSAKFNANYI